MIITSQSLNVRRGISDPRNQNSMSNDDKIIKHHENKKLYDRLCELDEQGEAWLDACPANGVFEINTALKVRVDELETELVARAGESVE